MKIKTVILSCLVGFVTLFSTEAGDQIKTNSDTELLNEIQTNFLNNLTIGQASNGISLGVKFVNSSQPDTFTWLLNVSQTNNNQVWLSPPQFQRVEYYLYDSSGKVVPYLATYHPTNMIYRTISDVPKNSHNVRNGLMLVGRGSPPMPYEQKTLRDIFQIERGGDYKLIVEGRIMKINDDGSLGIVEFPPVSLTIHLRDGDVSPKTKE